MFPTVIACAERLEEFLKKPAERSENLDVHTVVCSYTKDVITSCALGIEKSSLDSSEFNNNISRIVQNGDTFIVIRNFIVNVIPILKTVYSVGSVYTNSY